MKRAIFLFLAVLIFLFGWSVVTLAVLRHFGGVEWLSPGILYMAVIYPIIHGALHRAQDKAKPPEQKVLFGRIKISNRLYATLMTELLVLACCVFVKLLIGVSLRVMVAPITIATIYFVNEGVGYRSLQIITHCLDCSKKSA